MKLIERTFELSAPEGLGKKPRPELIGPVLTSLHDTLQDAVRMGFLHSSKAHGRIPTCLRAAADVHFLGHSSNGEGGTLLHFEVPVLPQLKAPELGLRQLARRLNPVMTAAQCAAAGYLLGATTSCAVICGSDNDAY